MLEYTKAIKRLIEQSINSYRAVKEPTDEQTAQGIKALSCIDFRRANAEIQNAIWEREFDELEQINEFGLIASYCIGYIALYDDAEACPNIWGKCIYDTARKYTHIFPTIDKIQQMRKASPMDMLQDAETMLTGVKPQQKDEDIPTYVSRLFDGVKDSAERWELIERTGDKWRWTDKTTLSMCAYFWARLLCGDKVEDYVWKMNKAKSLSHYDEAINAIMVIDWETPLQKVRTKGVSENRIKGYDLIDKVFG